MEVSRNDHCAEEQHSPSPISRRSFLGGVGPALFAVLMRGDAHHDDPRQPLQQNITCQLDTPVDPWTLPDDTSLLGRRLLLSRNCASIERVSGELIVRVNDETFTMVTRVPFENIPFGAVVRDIRLKNCHIHIDAPGYGTAKVHENLMRRLCAELAYTKEDEISFEIEGHFTPQEGSYTASAFAVWKLMGQPTNMFSVTFRRGTPSANAIAMGDTQPH